MEQTVLIEKLTAYGADMRGIEERFAGNAELYEKCYLNFLSEHNFELLLQALDSKKYDAAFAPAHALEELSGNLGLTPLYDALDTLVEALRHNDYRRADLKYDSVRTAVRRLKGLYAAEASADMPREIPAPERKQETLKVRMKIICIAIVMLAGVFAISMLFYNLIMNYKSNVSMESASHLAEINSQMRIYVEEKIEKDWRTAYSVANSLTQAGDGDENLLAFISRARDIWDVSDIILYTEDGYSISIDGDTMANDVASDNIYRAMRQGEYMTIIDSSITYTVGVNARQRYKGAKLMAVSVVQDMGPLLDNMHFSSFDGAAYMYLAQRDGTVLSRLTHPDSSSVFNVLSYLDGKQIVYLDGDGNEDVSENMLALDEPNIYVISNPDGDIYVVCTPVTTRSDDMLLFYFVPEAVVNKTMNGFSDDIVTMSAIVVSAFSLAAVLIFLLIYRNRKREFSRALMERERTFDLLVKNTNTAFGLLSTESAKPLYISPNIRRIVGAKHLRLVKTDEGYRMTNDCDVEDDALRQLQNEMQEWDGQSEFRSGYVPNPESQSAGFYSLQLYPISGTDSEYVAIAQDMTLMHDREEAVRNALHMAERSNSAKDRFLSNMSHDIRTPMNAIVNMTNFAIETIGEPQRQAKYLRIIRESSDHLLKLVNDVLDMSRIESGQAVMSAEPFDIRAVLNSVCDIVRPLCEARRQTFVTDFDGIKTTGIIGDQLKLSQIFMNLLSNSIKFTPEKGAIRFTTLELPSLQQDMVTLRFIVEDNGIGISKANIGRIFEPFMREDNKRTGSIEGTGLGLPICKSYVSAMGGSISCESEDEHGSVFTVELFFHKAHVNSEPRSVKDVSSEAMFNGRRCLVCEDNLVNQIIGRKVLERIGFDVEIAPDGMEGLNMFMASRPGYYDIIYMDIQMPALDGYQATVAIRDSDHPQASTIPIIAMTANVFAEDIEKARIAGMNGHLGKPLIVLDMVEETYKALKMAG